jgi:hypothetical protein
VYTDRVEVTTLAAATATPADASRKQTVTAWSPEAQATVSRHLATVREARRAQWRAWLDAQSTPLPE